jgi:CDP-glycerol glycerophosphotransferase
VPAPRFSIIIAVHNVRAYLRECLDSILDQDFTDFELIAVDDKTPDGSDEILDEYADADPRVKVVHLDQNVGLGKARDAGMAYATGQYLLFVDGDDTLTPGALGTIADRLAETADPDILVFDYARTYWNGGISRNILGYLFSAPGPDVFTIKERPELLTLLMVVWNKAYRRDFIEEHGFRFPVGFYEDIPWTYPAMITAQRVALLDHVCYHYRQRRHGNILGSNSRKHFDVFKQYDAVFAYLDAHPELDPWRKFLFTRMVRHLLPIVTNRGRISKNLQHQFFDAFVDVFHRHRPPTYEIPEGVAGIKLRTVERSDYRAFVAAATLGRAVRKSKRRAKKARKVTKFVVNGGKRSLILAYYHAALRLPIDENLVVYAAYWHRGYACNPAAIYEEAKRIAPHLRGVWVVARKFAHTVPPGVEYVELGSPEYYRVMATAKYFINNVNFNDNIVKRPGTVHVQTKHGTPLKTMGMALRDFPVGAADMDFPSLLKRCDRWDYVISSNRYSSEVWERSFPNAYTTLEIGYPRNDVLVRATAAEIAAVRKSLHLGPDKTVILYAPTFRDWVTGRRVEQLADLRDLAENLGNDHVILVRSHYLTREDKRLRELQDRGTLRDVSEHPRIEDLMIAADVLLTDYSSVMFDYANLDRPVVIFAPDWDTYVRVRGVNMDLFAQPPGVIETTQEGLVDAFVSGRYRGEDAEAARKSFIRTFCEFDDGHASERLVRRVLLGERTRAEPESQSATGVAQDDVGPQGDGAVADEVD